MLSFFPRDVLDGIWDLIGSVSEGFSTCYFFSDDFFLSSTLISTVSNRHHDVLFIWACCLRAKKYSFWPKITNEANFGKLDSMYEVLLT